MHNIFLGLLHHHGRDLFGLKMPAKKSNNEQPFQHRSTSPETESVHLDVERGSELSALEDTQLPNCEGNQKDMQNDSTLELLALFENLDLACAVGSETASSESASFLDSELDLHEDLNQEESEDDELFSEFDCEAHTDLNPLGSRFFGKTENLQTLRDVNAEFTLPSWIGRVPSTVGAAKGGKLKADEWVILFEVVMIPTLIRILFENESCNIFGIGVFENILHLTSIVNIVRSLKIGNEDIQALRFHLKAYRQGLLDIFPSFTTKPNHHLALHLPDGLHQLGAAPQWTAWSFERLNGSLASIPTNNHIGKQFISLIKFRKLKI
jgi:hypothetical protein